MSSPSLFAGQKPYEPRARSNLLSMMRPSSSCACSYSSVAAAPYFGCFRIAGNDPFSSHVEKKSVQSMYFAMSASGSSSRKCRPVNDGAGTFVHSSLGAFASASRYGRIRRRARLAYCSRMSACFFLFSTSKAAIFSGFRSVDTTSTARDASSTCTVVLP